MTTVNGVPFRVLPPPGRPTPADLPVSAPPASADLPDDLIFLDPDKPERGPGLLHRATVTVRGDLAHWRLHQARPASLSVRWRQRATTRAARVPDGNGLIKAVWLVDDWTFGLAVYGLAVLLFAVAGAVWWTAAHPLRRWAALILTVITLAWVVWG